MTDSTTSRVILGLSEEVLPELCSGYARMIYIDPPFNTGKRQARKSIRTVPDENGDRVGFKGRRYSSEVVSRMHYADSVDDYATFIGPFLAEAHRLLDESGTLYLHLDYREVHYAKVLCDGIFGRKNFLNEIIWAYDYGGRPKRRWPAKHDNILVYAKDLDRYHFDSAEVEREPYMAPGLVTAEKAALGKLPTDVWWHTIVSPTGREKTGYPTQKPLGILRRMISASTRPGDRVLDFFAGSGTTGEAAWVLGRDFTLVDASLQAFEVMRSRLDQTGAGFEIHASAAKGSPSDHPGNAMGR